MRIDQQNAAGLDLAQAFPHEQASTDRCFSHGHRRHAAAHVRGFGITGFRVGLFSTASDIYASAGAVA